MTEPFGLLLAFGGDDAGDIRFALSEGADALRWRVLRDSAGVLSGAGSPFLVREESGRVVCLAAAGGELLAWFSGDLADWDGPHVLPVGVAGAGAPKAYRDGNSWQLIFTAEGRAFTARTSDFRTVAAVAPLTEDAGSDVALLHAAGGVFAFHAPGGRLVQSRADGSVVTEIGAGQAAVVFAGLGGRTWYLLVDDGTGLRPYVTRVIANGAWQPAGADGMPAGARRGGVIAVTEDEFKRLEAHA